MSEWHVQAWDSTMFITLVMGVEADRCDVIRSLLASYDEQKLQIVVSTFAIAEVRSYRKPDTPGPEPGAEGSAATLPVVAEPAEVVRRMFESDQLIIRAVTPRIADMAADLGNRYPDLLPGDCVHIATAMDADVDVLFTYDGVGRRRRPNSMLRYDGKIGDPPLSIKEPWDIWPTIWSAGAGVAPDHE
jgi:predicted nucleic acid-binding protein